MLASLTIRENIIIKCNMCQTLTRLQCEVSVLDWMKDIKNWNNHKYGLKMQRVKNDEWPDLWWWLYSQLLNYLG
jgi:hypothetical protein